MDFRPLGANSRLRAPDCEVCLFLANVLDVDALTWIESLGFSLLQERLWTHLNSSFIYISVVYRQTLRLGTYCDAHFALETDYNYI